MVLFDNANDANLRACAQMVEDVLTGRGLDAEKARKEREGGLAWTLRQGSAEVQILLTPGHAEANNIQVTASVIRATRAALEGTALYRRLLELNAVALHQAAFGLRGDHVILTADRSTAGLDPVEVDEMIRRIADYADHYDDALVAEFGGQRSSDL
jgi:hypothetical protein